MVGHQLFQFVSALCQCSSEGASTQLDADTHPLRSFYVKPEREMYVSRHRNPFLRMMLKD